MIRVVEMKIGNPSIDRLADSLLAFSGYFLLHFFFFFVFCYRTYRLLDFVSIPLLPHTIIMSSCPVVNSVNKKESSFHPYNEPRLPFAWHILLVRLRKDNPTRIYFLRTNLWETGDRELSLSTPRTFAQRSSLGLKVAHNRIGERSTGLLLSR
jgi:hypothetical protein